MAVVRPFKSLRPRQDIVEKVACLPYDVMNRPEAKKMAEGNPDSFLHVVRSEMDVPDEMDAYDPLVYQTARKNLDKFQEDGILVQDETPRFYIYRQLMWGRVQTGIVGCNSIDEYMNDTIKKHEFTRPVKEQDRINNFDYCDANTAPIFLTYKKNDEINHMVNEWIKFHKPVYNFISDDEITHIVWEITSEEVNSRIEEIFAGIDYLYIADGHHRSASSVKVGMKRREEFPNYTGEEEFNFFMSVIFPDEDLFIMDYNRVVQDLNGHSTEEFFNMIKEKFDVEEVGTEVYKPMVAKTYGMHLEGKWYKLTAKEGIYDMNDPVGRLDVSILQENLLNPVLGIENPRTDNRIDFIGGIRGLEELERRCTVDMAVAFSMYPTTMDDLIAIADAGEVMPPKSTWFEPKLRSGLFVHKLAD
ncbi:MULTISPECIES: DUF1015 domain-containing protein [unclassified Fusibacter]|uniref:DUF1015 domain-containing protein n=1 Tax=unclassified Fusibacter TaxID=2624464 RepID=UPI0010133B9C|nr:MULTISPECIES: DUF1015 family protein [unclassified Fusibacter]MCK8059770.1 DUF1015 family protein [Fusibacter sp. A2]NPE21571.1 DUF1015 domain-containing protein [Fusibacter sp. A1]RXV61979.1 DUF1015 domain-containing protein [Fusibacter sp. A1]